MGTATLTPNADVAKSGTWTYSSGSTIYSLLNDSSDSSWLYTTNGTFTVDFTTYTLPSGSVVKSVTPKFRAGTLPPTTWVQVYTTARGTTGSQYSIWSIASVPVSTRAVTSLIDVPGLSGTPWVQTDIDGLRLYWYETSFPAYGKLYELSVDVLYAEVPTVTAVTATNYYTSTPSVSWTYTAGADGGAQTRYEVKLYDSAAYGAGGFSPDTTTPTYETTGYSTVTSITIPAGTLANTTYKAYVRVAQTINGAYQTSIGGTGSGWAASGAFTIAPDPPAPVTLTVTPDQANNRTGLAIQGHDNLMSEQDANLETGGSTGNWAALTNCTVAQSTTQAISPGTGSLRLSSSAAGDMEARTATGTSGYPVVAGREYRVRGSFRAGATTRSCKIGVAWYDSGGSIIGSASYSSTVSGTSTGFTEAYTDLTAPANAVYATVRAHVASCAAASELFYVDHIALQENAGNAPAAWYRGGLVGTAATGVKAYAAEYSDDSGSTWSSVFAGSAIADSTNQLAATFYDYAYTPGTTRQYRAYAYYTQSGTTTDGATSAGSQTATLDLDHWRFVDVTTSTQLELQVVGDEPFQRRRPRAVNDILGASYPIVVDDTRKAIEATLTLETTTSQESDDLDDILDSGNTLLLQGPSAAGAANRWIRTGDTSCAPISQVLPYWKQWTVPYTQVAAPAS